MATILFPDDHRAITLLLLTVCFFVIQRQIKNASVLDGQPLQFAEFAYMLPLV